MIHWAHSLHSFSIKWWKSDFMNIINEKQDRTSVKLKEKSKLKKKDGWPTKYPDSFPCRFYGCCKLLMIHWAHSLPSNWGFKSRNRFSSWCSTRNWPGKIRSGLYVCTTLYVLRKPRTSQGMDETLSQTTFYDFTT